MKPILFFLFLSVSAFAQNKISSISNDSILLVTMDENPIYVSKNTLEDVIKEHPEFLNIDYKSPDILYAINSKGFESEVGQNDYFIFYTYFLKSKLKNKFYEDERIMLISNYHSLNKIFSLLEVGGTYFAHMYVRVHGYAEYSIALYNYEQNEDVKQIDISEQKKLFISSLNQIVDDRLENEWEYTDQDKSIVRNEIQELIKLIDSQITEPFFLSELQKFLYSNYRTY